MSIDDSRFLNIKNEEAVNNLVDCAINFQIRNLNFLSVETKLLLLSVRKTNKATGQEYAWAHLVDLPQFQLYTRAKMVWEARVQKKSPRKKMWPASKSEHFDWKAALARNDQ